ncbi:MAG: M28 family peptidase, partial [Dehalococcoidia bacterium]
EHPWAAEVGVFVNLEASGTSGPSILFETTEDNAWLIEAYRTHAPKPVANSFFDAIIGLTSQNTDLNVFEEHGLSGINFAFVADHAHYHTPLDNLANLDPGSVQHHGDNALAAVRAFAGLDLANPPAGSDAFVDLLPGFVVQWPESLTVWIALAAVILLLGVATRLIRRGQLTLRALLWGLLVFPLGVLVAAVVGFAWAMAISALTGAPVPWYANPLPMRVAVWTGALLSLLLIASLVARRTGFWGLSLGVWLWWPVLAGLVGWLAPGVSVMFLPPAVLATLALAVVGLTPLRARPWARELAALVALAGASWFWLPFAIGIEDTEGGIELAAMIAFATALAVSAVAPFVALPLEYHRRRRWPLAGAALLIVAATGAALLLPVYSTERPQQLNLLHVELRQGNEAMWLLETGLAPETNAADVPPALLDAGQFAGESQPVLPWSNRRYLLAPAPATDAPAPAVEVLSDELVAGERVVELQLRSPRGGHQLSLYVPETAGLQQIAVVGTPLVVDDTRPRNGYQVFHCHTTACDGMTLELHLASRDAVELFVVDMTPGLPAGAADLIAARPPTAVPSRDGDLSLIVDQVSLAAS